MDDARSLLRRITGRQHAGDGDGELWPLYWQHDSKQRIGSILTAREDDHGLLVTGQIDFDTEYGRNAYDEMKRGALTGFSIGYRATKTGSGFLAELGKRVRKLFEVALEEISVVWCPANDQAQLLEVKSLRFTPEEDNNMRGGAGGLDAILADIERKRARAAHVLAVMRLEQKANAWRDSVGQPELLRQYDEVWDAWNDAADGSVVQAVLKEKLTHINQELCQKSEVYRAAEERHQASNAERREFNEYICERKAARERHEPEPPHPHYAPEAWRQWRHTRDWKQATG